MYFDLKVTALEVFTLIYCCYGSFVVVGASSENVLGLDAVISLTNQPKKLLHREKRQGGGGVIPFRPLFVYRQQQKEKQERWKEIEARKKLKQQYQQYEETIKQNQQLHQSRPHTATYGSTYNYPYSQRPYATYGSYDYPSTQYVSYYPTNSNSRYEYGTDGVYLRENPSNYYDGYGYEYS